MRATLTALRASPFLHVDETQIYNPLSDRTLRPEDSGYAEMQAVISGLSSADDLPRELCRGLSADGWLSEVDHDSSRSFFLKYVSLEAHTLCNQACYFCPVSIDPRRDYFMPTEQYESIVDSLSAYRDTIEAVFMINYNEPTADRRFVDQVRTIQQAGLPPATLTNGTGLTPDRIDRLVEMGGLRFLSINLSTLDAERYKADRGHAHLDLVLRNLDHAKDLPLAREMDIVVLGTGDDVHRADFEAIQERFAGSRFHVKYFEVMDRAGYLDVGLVATLGQELCGCDNVGSRPLQHLHITPQAKVVLCCEDYDERYVVGDLNEESLEDVLGGSKIAQMRRWAYGLETAPDDFICRRCVFARTRKACG